MEGVFRPTLNLGNSVIGVGILAMPYCIQKVRYFTRGLACLLVRLHVHDVSLSLSPLSPCPSFSQCGLILGMLLLAASAVFTVWSLKMLVRAAHTSHKASYEQLGRHQAKHSLQLLLHL